MAVRLGGNMYVDALGGEQTLRTLRAALDVVESVSLVIRVAVRDRQEPVDLPNGCRTAGRKALNAILSRMGFGADDDIVEWSSNAEWHLRPSPEPDHQLGPFAL